MSTAARRRLMRDFKRMQTDPPAGVSASPIADNVMTWYALPTLFPQTPRRVPSSIHIRLFVMQLTQDSKIQERSHHRPLRHTLRRRYLSPRDALRRTIPEQTSRREVHQPDVSSECLRYGGVVSGYFAEPLESDVRCCCNLDVDSEVRRYIQRRGAQVV